MTESAEPRLYAPQRRTALVLTGTGTAGAYHAGVLRALHEAGVKLDIVAGRGIGAVSALFAAIDGGQSLWSEKGFWQSAGVRALYAWRPALAPRVLGGRARGRSSWRSRWRRSRPARWCSRSISSCAWSASAAPAASRACMRADAAVVRAGRISDLAAAARRARPRMRPRSSCVMRTVLSAKPAASARAVLVARRGLAAVVARGRGALLAIVVGPAARRGGAQAADAGGSRAPLRGSPRGQHRPAGLSRAARGRPRSRRAPRSRVRAGGRAAPPRHLIRRVEHGGRRGAARRSARSLRRRAIAPGRRRGRVARRADRHGPARADICARRLLARRDAPGVRQAGQPDAYPRGAGRPGRRAGDPRVGVARAARPARAARRAGSTARAGSASTCSRRKPRRCATRRSSWPRRTPRMSTFTIRPGHNPIGPFDFSGEYDDRSDRRQPLTELMSHGYEDAYHQFIEPVLGASGEQMGAEECRTQNVERQNEHCRSTILRSTLT